MDEVTARDTTVMMMAAARMIHETGFVTTATAPCTEWTTVWTADWMRCAVSAAFAAVSAAFSGTAWAAALFARFPATPLTPLRPLPPPGLGSPPFLPSPSLLLEPPSLGVPTGGSLLGSPLFPCDLPLWSPGLLGWLPSPFGESLSFPGVEPCSALGSMLRLVPGMNVGAERISGISRPGMSPPSRY